MSVQCMHPFLISRLDLCIISCYIPLYHMYEGRAFPNVCSAAGHQTLSQPHSSTIPTFALFNSPRTQIRTIAPDMRVDRAMSAFELASSFKENQPPKKSNRTVDVSGLFAQTDRLRQKNAEDARNPLAPRPAGITKTAANPRIFAQFSKPRGKEHPVYTSFKETLSEYKQGAAEARVDELQPIYEELVARVDGFDANGHAIDAPGVPTQADIDALAALEEDLSKPLDDDVLQMRDRSGAVTDLRLGDAIRKFEAKSEKKRAELTKLLEQLKEIEGEIEVAQKDALRCEKTEVKKLRDELAVELETFKEAALKGKQQTEAEVNAAMKADKKAKKEWEAKIAALTD